MLPLPGLMRTRYSHSLSFDGVAKREPGFALSASWSISWLMPGAASSAVRSLWSFFVKSLFGLQGSAFTQRPVSSES